jgi:LysM repeat protein
LLINVIQKYNLTQYDSPETEPQKEKREDRVLTQINDNTIVAKQDSAVQTDTTNKLYTVATGDTLYSISRRFGITVEDLKSLNSLSDNNIKIGQKLIVAK